MFYSQRTAAKSISGETLSKIVRWASRDYTGTFSRRLFTVRVNVSENAPYHLYVYVLFLQVPLQSNHLSTLATLFENARIR